MMAELHVVGQVLGATGFQGQSIFCKVRRFLLMPGLMLMWLPAAQTQLLLLLRFALSSFAHATVGRACRQELGVDRGP